MSHRQAASLGSSGIKHGKIAFNALATVRVLYSPLFDKINVPAKERFQLDLHSLKVDSRRVH